MCITDKLIDIVLIIIAIILSLFILGLLFWPIVGEPKSLENASEELLWPYITIQKNSLTPISPIDYPYQNEYTIMIDRIISCESNWNNDVRGKAGEIGLAQFLPNTWQWMCKEAGFNGDIYNKEHQLYILEWALKNNLGSHWICYPKP